MGVHPGHLDATRFNGACSKILKNSGTPTYNSMSFLAIAKDS